MSSLSAKIDNERDLFCLTCSFFVCLFAVGMFCFVFIPYSLISHILSVELDTLNCTFFLFFNYFYYLLPIDIELVTDS